MEVFLIFHKEQADSEVNVLDVYVNEIKAQNRVDIERELNDEIIWYEEFTINQ